MVFDIIYFDEKVTINMRKNVFIVLGWVRGRKT